MSQPQEEGSRDENHYRVVAYHEAGHAVAHFWLNLPFRRVTIRSEDDSAGRVEVDRPRSIVEDTRKERETPRSRVRLHDEAIAAFAGTYAQARADLPGDWYGSQSDRHEACDLLVRLVGSNPEILGAYIKLVDIQAKHLVESRWSSVVAVAEVLLKRRELGWRAVRRIIREEQEREFQAKMARVEAANSPAKVAK